MALLSAIIPSQKAARSRTSFTATANQTTFNFTYAVGSLEVYLNGVLLNDTDYTATSGTSFTLNTGADVNDIVEAISFKFAPVGQASSFFGTLPIASGGTGSTSTTFVDLATNVTGTLPTTSGGTGTTSTTFVNLATNVVGTLPVTNGGTGTTISTGTGNVVLADSPTLNYAQLNNPTLVSAFELANVRNEAPPAVVNIDMLDRNGSIIFFTSNTSANITVNFRGNASTTLDAWLGTTASNANVATSVMLVTHGTTQYYVNNVLIDGRIMHNSSIKGNLFWQGNTLSSGGTGAAIDSYGFTVIKNGGTRGGASYGGNVYTILGSQTSFKSFLA
jgi:hypothetical protein